MNDTSAISATKVRTALMEGKRGEAAKALEPKVAEVLTRPENVRTMQTRNSLIKKQKQAVDNIDNQIEDEFKNLTDLAVQRGFRAPSEKPMTRLVGKVTKSDDPNIVASMARIKDLRENEKKRINSKYNKQLSELQHQDPIQFAEGYTPNFALNFIRNKDMFNVSGSVSDVLSLYGANQGVGSPFWSQMKQTYVDKKSVGKRGKNRTTNKKRI